MNAWVEASIRETALGVAENAEDQAALRERGFYTARFRLWGDLVIKHGVRNEPVVELATDMQMIADGNIDIRERLEAEIQYTLEAAIAGHPMAAKRFEQFADAARRVASGTEERGVNLETRALLAFARASRGFREVPAKDRVVAMVAEELEKRKLPKGTENKVRATIGPLYKP